MKWNEKWTNVTVGNCIAIHETLADIYGLAGHLPGGKTPQSSELEMTRTLIDFAEVVLNAQVFWDEMPEARKPSPEEVSEHREMVRQITETTTEGRELFVVGGSDVPKEQVLDELAEESADEFREGISREKIREQLKQLLDDCR